ncbi:amidase [Embleya sp. NPDC005971]|uniref:amidase n=1 Tax=unclassified Embleya TaxID=2699296 RepID=UPI0033EACA77
MDTDELLDRHDAVGLADLVRTGHLSPHELLDAVAARVATRNPVVNAVVSTRLDQARREIDRGLPDGPLRGVPFALKDIGCDIAGLATTNGSRLFADAIAERDGELATRYRRAGLVLIGKTNTSEFGKNSSTEPRLHGPTRNPWRTSHSAGGSSGGSAAAVAAGILPVAHANDGGGSTRIPASYCGLFGLKPSRGRVPDDQGEGALAYPFAANHAVTRTVRDSAALLDAVAGPRWGDAHPELPPPSEGSFLAALRTPPGRLRIGVTPGSAADHPTAVDAVARVAGVLADLGHHVEEAAPAWDAAAASRAAGVVMAASVAAQIQDRLTVLGRDLAEDDVEPFTRFLHDRLAGSTAVDLHRALRTAERTGRQIAPFFAEFDIWLCPTVAVPVPRLGVLDTADPASMIRNAPATVTYTQVFNICGLPAASVPAGFDPAGLPVGVQIGGRMGAEAVLLQLAAQLETAIPWPWQAPWPAPGA